MPRFLGALFNRWAALRAQLRDRAQLLEELSVYKRFVPPGHFYSPIPSLEEVAAREQVIFHRVPRAIPGIDLNEEKQLELFESFKEYYQALPFPVQKTKELRFFYDNPAYSYSDAIFLHCMIRHVQPKRIIEVGSGYSSCVTLDTNELCFANRISCTFVEPYPQLLESLLKADDKARIEIIPHPLQEVDISLFSSLAPGDILFVDSTHVAKVGSDVNYLFFEILPSLPCGVYVHFHDIFYPFEYPREWIYEGRAWNENYMLRAFLEYNGAFRIVFFNTFLEHFHEARFAAEMPLCLKNKGGSIWLQKIGD
jgi:hypothetical protein